MARNYHQGKYRPINPEKYVGDIGNIVFRSSWERKFMWWADNNANVLKWGSEEIVIPYLSPLDGRMHRYFVDFIIMYKDRQGNIKKALIEVKPKSQTIKPELTKRKKKKVFLEESIEYAKNTAKWSAARDWCADRGVSFVILTEKELGIK